MKLYTFAFASCLLAAHLPCEADVLVALTPTRSSVELGAVVTLGIEISGLDGELALSTYDLELGYDSSLLAYTQTTFGDQLDILRLGSIQSADPTTEGLRLFELSLDTEEDLSAGQASSFRLATLLFTTLGVGVSPISVTVNVLGDAAGDSLPTSVREGYVTISAIPLPPALYLLGSSILTLGTRQFIFRHRNSPAKQQLS